MTAIPSLIRDDNGAPIPVLGCNNPIEVADAATSAAIDAYVIRVVAIDADAEIFIGAAPAIAGTGIFIPKGVPEYFKITPGHKVATSGATLNISTCC
jgi:hypothetical protein